MNSELPARVGELLGDLSGRTGIDAPVETAKVWSSWRDIVGPEIAGHAVPTSLKQGVLRVRADSPAWATEIGYLSEEILRRTNAAVGAATVVEVRVWTGPGRIARGQAGAASAGRSGAPAADGKRGAEDDPVTAFQRVRAAWSRRRARHPGGPG